MEKAQKEIEVPEGHIVGEIDDFTEKIAIASSEFQLNHLFAGYINPKVNRTVYEYYKVNDNGRLTGPEMVTNSQIAHLVVNTKKTKRQRFDLDLLPVPKNVIRIETSNKQTTVFWKLDAGTRSIKYEYNGKIYKVSVLFPASMMGIVIGSKELSHFTVGRDKKKRLMLFPSFLPNVYASGKFCMGQNTVSYKDINNLQELLNHCTNLVYEGVYTHYHNDNSDNDDLIREYIEAKCTEPLALKLTNKNGIRINETLYASLLA